MSILSHVRKTLHSPAGKATLVSLLGVSALGIGARSVRAASLADMPGATQGVIPAAAANHGVGGTYWHTDVKLYQNGADNVFWNACGGNLAHPATNQDCVHVSVPRGHVVALDDFASTFTNVPPPLGIFYSWDGLPANQGLVFSRTYTIAPNGQPGTLGQGIPGILITDLPTGDVSQLAPLSSDPTKYRANVGLSNPTANQETVTLRVRGEGGAILATQDIVLPGFSWTQLNNIYTTMHISPIPQTSYIEAQSTSTATFTLYASVIDNVSGDPTNLAAQWTTDSASDYSIFRFIPAAAHLNGYNGAQWRTDTNTINWNDQAQDGNFILMLQDQDNFNNPGPTAIWPQSDHALQNWNDVLTNAFLGYNLDGQKGALQTNEPRNLVFARTYNDLGASGTFGQEFPAIKDSDGAHEGETFTIAGISHNPALTDGYRTNLGLVNTNLKESIAHITISSQDGTVLCSFDKTLLPWDMTQINKVTEQCTTNPVTNGLLTITNTTNSGDVDHNPQNTIIAYASMVDNQSGDPTTVLGKKLPTITKITGEQYVEQWFDWLANSFYLSNTETRCMINGNCSTRSYAPDMSAILVNAKENTNNTTPAQLDQLLLNWVDGNPSNGELYTGFDPLATSMANSVVAMYFMPNGNTTVTFTLTPTYAQQWRTNVVRPFLVQLVDSNPSWYGGSTTTGPSLTYNPTWNTQDQNTAR